MCTKSGNRGGHELSMDHWKCIYDSSESQKMIAQKTRFVGVSTVFFIIFYFTLPLLVGYWPEWMSFEVWGVVNWAYLFAFSQFLMAWAVAYCYMVFAGQFDKQAAKSLSDTMTVGGRTEDRGER